MENKLQTAIDALELMRALTDIEKHKLKGMVCPYCNQKTKLFKDSSVVYSKNFGPIWACLPCKAWVGCHPGTNKPLGRIATKALRELKIEAHKYFDRIYTYKIMRRSAAYKWLSGELRIPKKYTHIGMFNEQTCKKVAAICKDFLNHHYLANKPQQP
jgi:ribosomal protein L37AE/L43A